MGQTSGFRCARVLQRQRAAAEATATAASVRTPLPGVGHAGTMLSLQHCTTATAPRTRNTQLTAAHYL